MFLFHWNCIISFIDVNEDENLFIFTPDNLLKCDIYTIETRTIFLLNI